MTELTWTEKQDLYEEETTKQVELAASLLTQQGFHLEVNGCGCCDSPRVYLAYRGTPIIHHKGEERNFVVIGDFS